MLDNAATPKYYAKFRTAVQTGAMPISREIAMEMERIDELIANPRYYFDEDPVEGFIEFCNGELVLTDGSPFEMVDSFKLWAEQLFGWYFYADRTVYEIDDQGKGQYVNRKELRRLTVKQYLIVGRGAAKTMYAMAVQLYFLVVDQSTTDQIVVAPTLKQTEETFGPIRTALLAARGPVLKFMTNGAKQNTKMDLSKRQMVVPNTDGITNYLTNSKIRPRVLSIDRLQGLRCKVATLDEWLSGHCTEDPIAAIEQGASKIDGYIIVAISSEGTVRNGVGDEMKMELAKILRGEYYAPHVSIWHYKLDDVKEVGDINMWIKANPNIGITVKYETYQADVERMENAPSARNDILAKRFGIPTEGYTYFFAYEQTIPHRRHEFWKMPCSMGMDASQGDDFCSFTFLFPLGGDKYGVKTRNYISERTLYKLPPVLRNKYEEFMQEGTLAIMPGTTIDMIQVYEDLLDFIDRNEYDVCCFGFDPYNAREFVERWSRENGDYGVEKVIQGAKTESVPLGELHKLAEDRNLIFDESIMQYCMGNCIALEDTNGNRKLMKRRYEYKIDTVAALMDAWVAYKLHKEVLE